MKKIEMKKIYMAIAALLVAGSTFAQTETNKTMSDTADNKIDTIKVGNFIIIKKRKSNNDENTTTSVTVERKEKKPGKLSTNWFIFDLGFANTNDKTAYSSTTPNKYFGSLTKDDFKLKASKSSNVNIWLVMQKLNLAKGYVNLKYGIGLEMFNLRYERSINYQKDPTPYVLMDSIKFSKNKVYAGYATVPFMINFNTMPGNKKKAFSFSAGISAGYLIGSHDKQISGERGKDKTHGDIGLSQFRLAYIGELGLGPIRLFGSYAITKLHDKGLEQYPYSLGIRFSNW